MAPVEAAESAVEVADRGAEQHPADPGEHRVAEVLVQRRHRAGAMPPLKRLPITSSSPARSRSTNGSRLGEVVAVVGVAHDDVLAAGGLDPAHERAAVPLGRDVDDPRAVRARRSPASRRSSRCRRRSPRRGRRCARGFLGLVDADRERLGLVEARHDDRELDRLGRRWAWRGILSYAGQPHHRTEWVR